MENHISMQARKWKRWPFSYNSCRSSPHASNLCALGFPWSEGNVDVGKHVLSGKQNPIRLTIYIGAKEIPYICHNAMYCFSFEILMVKISKVLGYVWMGLFGWKKKSFSIEKAKSCLDWALEAFWLSEMKRGSPPPKKKKVQITFGTHCSGWIPLFLPNMERRIPSKYFLFQPNMKWMNPS